MYEVFSCKRQFVIWVDFHFKNTKTAYLGERFYGRI